MNLINRLFLLYIFEKLINIDFWIWQNDILLIKLEKEMALQKIPKYSPVNHFKESNINV